MKIPNKLSLSLAAVVLLAVPTTAQVEGPPDAIDYQGRVLDALGDPVANGTVENIEMYFRIWKHISSSQVSELVWAEKQIVTVSSGDFSVRLGEGDPIESAAGDNVINPGFDDDRPPLLTVFDGKERFLGVSVAANSTVKPTSEILPRLAFLTAPFAAVAEKARFAEFGPSDPNTYFTVSSKLGVGTTSPSSLLEVDGLGQLSPSDGTGLISSGPWAAQHISLDADDIQSYANGSTPSLLRLNDHGGNIEMGSFGNQTTVDGLFTVKPGNFLGEFRVVNEAAVNNAQVITSVNAPFGVQASQIRFEGSVPAVEIGQNSSGEFVVESSTGAQRLVVSQNGNVGLGITSPSDRLTVGGGHMLLTSGNVKHRTRSSGQFFIYYDTGSFWYDHQGTIKSRIYHDGSANRLYFVNSDVSATDGVYLAEGGNTWLNGSDERLKSDLEPVTGILDKIEDIRVVSYNMAIVKEDQDTGKTTVAHNRAPRKTKSGKVIKHEIGTIAQDWLKHFPELVDEPQNEDDHYALAYSRIGVVALGGVQELNAKVEELNTKVKEQEAQIKARDAVIGDLKARVARIEGLILETVASPSTTR